MKIIINGYGRMGKAVESECLSRGFEYIAVDESLRLFNVENADGVIDFSVPESLDCLLEYCQKNFLPLVIATTGHSEEQKKKIAEASKNIPVAYSANFGLGIAFLKKVVYLAAKTFPSFDAEIIELHHRYKKDSPSGTAKELFEAIKSARGYAVEVDGRSGNKKRQNGEVGISSARLGSEVGTHAVVFCGDDEEVVLTHSAFSRSTFAKGALDCLMLIKGEKRGLFTPEDLI